MAGMSSSCFKNSSGIHILNIFMISAIFKTSFFLAISKENNHFFMAFAVGTMEIKYVALKTALP